MAAGRRASDGSGSVARNRLSERSENGSLSGWASNRPESRADRGTGTAGEETGLCEAGGLEGGEPKPEAGERVEGAPGRGVGTPLAGGEETAADGALLGGLADGGALTDACTGDDGRMAEGGGADADAALVEVAWGGMLEPMRR